MKHFVAIILCCIIVIDSRAQHAAKANKPQQQLKIGDKIPDLLITEFVDKRPHPLHLSDLYKKGGLIINFWATWCAPCLEELPRLNSLASKYSNKLGVLSVAYEDPELIEKFLKNHRDLNFSNLNLIAGDTILVEYLKHRSLPYNVWVDSSGVISNTTHGDEINEKNINDFINGRKLKVLSATEMVNFSFEAPFHYQDSSFLYRSIITKNTPGIPSGFNILSRSVNSSKWLTNRIYAFNNSISSLYIIAYSKLVTPRYHENFFGLVEFHTKDSLRYFSPKLTSSYYKNSKYRSRDEWAIDHTYCYDLTLPNAIDAKEAFDLMFNDLQRNFHLKTKIDHQMRMRSIITLSDPSKRNMFRPSVKDSSIIKKVRTGLFTQNNKIDFLYEYMNDKFSPSLTSPPEDPPYINETGINIPIDLTLDYSKPMSYREIKDLLEKKYGLKVTYEKRSVPILIVTDDTI